MTQHTPAGPLEIRVRRTFEHQPPQVIITWDGKSRSKEAALTLVPLIAKAPEMRALLNKIGYEPWGHAEASHVDILRQVVEEARALLREIEGDK